MTRIQLEKDPSYRRKLWYGMTYQKLHKLAEPGPVIHKNYSTITVHQCLHLTGPMPRIAKVYYNLFQFWLKLEQLLICKTRGLICSMCINVNIWFIKTRTQLCTDAKPALCLNLWLNLILSFFYIPSVLVHVVFAGSQLQHELEASLSSRPDTPQWASELDLPLLLLRGLAY